MKKLIANPWTWILIIGFATATYAAVVNIKETGAGLQIGRAASSGYKIGFFGATPVSCPNISTGGVSTAAFSTNIFNALISLGMCQSTN